MKRIANYLIALAVAAFTFTSCEDVPSPFGEIIKPSSGETTVIEPSGTGTEADPYNIAGVLEFISGLGADTPSDKEVFIRGYVSEITDISAQYGNATFNMSDTEDGTANKFTVYRAKGLGGENVTDEKFIKQGDLVVIYGKVTNYKGNTPETVQGAAYVYSVNGTGGGGTTPKPTEEVKKVTVAEFNAAAESTTQYYQLTGTVKNLKDGDQYGNFDLEDATGSVYVYGLLSEKGGESKKFQDLASAKGIKNGVTLTIIGLRSSFNEKIQVKGAYFVSVEAGGGTTTGDAKGSGTQADPYNAAGANKYISSLAADTESSNDVYIKGKLVKYADKGEFGTQYGNASFYLSDDGTENGEQFYVFRTLYLGNVKYTGGNTPAPGDEIIICGKVVNYKGNTPETAANKSYIYYWDKSTSGGGDTGGAKGTGTEADPFNVAAAIAKCKEVGTTASTEKYYIKGIADADYTVSSYKNVEIDIVDEAGSADKFKVFRVKDKDGKGIKEGYKIAKGAVIIVYGPVVNYKENTPETASGAYLVSVDGKAPELDGEDGGGTSGGGSSAATTLTNGDFETWADGLPTGWKSASTASSATLSQSTDAHGGKFSVNVNGNESSNKRLACQEITLAAGTYTFSFYAKATTADAAQVRPGYVPITDGSAGSYSYGDYANINNNGWTQVTYEFTLSAESTVCLVVMNPKKSNYSAGKDVLVDDATLTKK